MAAMNNHMNYASGGEKLTQYHFSRMKAGRSSREIHRLVIQEPNGLTHLQGEDIIEHMTEKYEEIARKDPQVGNLTIEEFLGDDLVQLSKVLYGFSLLILINGVSINYNFLFGSTSRSSLYVSAWSSHVWPPLPPRDLVQSNNPAR